MSLGLAMLGAAAVAAYGTASLLGFFDGVQRGDIIGRYCAYRSTGKAAFLRCARRSQAEAIIAMDSPAARYAKSSSQSCGRGGAALRTESGGPGAPSALLGLRREAAALRRDGRALALVHVRCAL